VENEIVGEVIEASTIEFRAESRELHSPPAFGCFVRVSVGAQSSVPSSPVASPQSVVDDDPFESSDSFGTFRQASGGFGRAYREIIEGESSPDCPGLDPAIFGIVCGASTGPVDSSRKLRAFWKDEDQMQEDHPEISEWLLVTHFNAMIIGHTCNGAVQHLLPPQPPKLFSQVRACTDDEIRLITRKMDFLRTIVNSHQAPAEEVIAACILRAYEAYDGDFNFLVAAGKELASLMKDDYDRLQAIIRRVSPW